MNLVTIERWYRVRATSSNDEGWECERYTEECTDEQLANIERRIEADTLRRESIVKVEKIK